MARKPEAYDCGTRARRISTGPAVRRTTKIHALSDDHGRPVAWQRVGTRPGGILPAISGPSHKAVSIASMARRICVIDLPIREQNPSSLPIQPVRALLQPRGLSRPKPVARTIC